MRKIRRTYLVVLIIGCAAAVLTVMALTAYFAKGIFKDVFVNKEVFFSADALYSISSVDASKREVGSAGAQREINIYNYDLISGDFNAFDITFDVYAWLDEALQDGKDYTLTVGGGNSVAISTTVHTDPVLRDIILLGGKRSAVTLSVDFGYQEGDDLSGATGLNLVVVPTTPKRLSGACLGALIRPTWSEAFAVNSDLDHTGSVEDYAAFTYRVSTVGNSRTDDKIVVKWKSDALILIHVNGKEPDTVQKGNFGDGFDRKIEWDVQSNHTDTLVFFRNTKNDMWRENQDWETVRGQISTEYVKNSTQE